MGQRVRNNLKGQSSEILSLQFFSKQLTVMVINFADTFVKWFFGYTGYIRGLIRCRILSFIVNTTATGKTEISWLKILQQERKKVCV
jgi:hypothetical protein